VDSGKNERRGRGNNPGKKNNIVIFIDAIDTIKKKFREKGGVSPGYHIFSQCLGGWEGQKKKKKNDTGRLTTSSSSSAQTTSKKKKRKEILGERKKRGGTAIPYLSIVSKREMWD